MDISALYQLYRQHPTITTDSRNCPVGSIFIALKGESFDGNKFASMALEKGCSYAIIDEKEYLPGDDDRYLLVDNCLQTFKELAREHRRQFNIPIIGITGTNGKTTTKELISAVLAEKYHVMHTEGNFNNDIGVPKTLLTLNSEHDIAVVEMGASHPGDIKKLVDYVEPTCGLITNVGRAHLQGFGSFEGVKRTKGELYDYLSANNALLFLNTGNNDLVQMAEQRNFDRIITYAQGKTEAYVNGEIIDCAPFLHFRWRELGGEWKEVQTQLIGAYNIDNMLAAIAMGLHFQVGTQQICHALENYTPSNSRSQLVQTPYNHLIVDAYNANPSSMAAAIDNFLHMDVGKKMVILGDMRELGEVSAAEHQKIVNMLEAAKIESVWLVGEEFCHTSTPFHTFKNVDEVKAAIQKERPTGFYILIKGSNGIHLSQIPELL